MSEPDRQTPHRQPAIRKGRSSTSTRSSTQTPPAETSRAPHAANDANGAHGLHAASAASEAAASQQSDRPDPADTASASRDEAGQAARRSPRQSASSSAWQTMQAQALLWQNMLAAMARANAPAVPAASLASLRHDYFTAWADGFRAASTVESTPIPSSGPAAARSTVSVGTPAASAPSLPLAERFADHVHRINADAMRSMAHAVQGDADTMGRLAFLVEQWIAATAPANVFGLNAIARAAMHDSRGASLRAGIGHLLDDLRQGMVTQSDPAAFKIGETLAATPGAVVMETPLFQLLQYAPRRGHYKRPLLIVPPCINKFYILDLQQHNSLVRCLCDAGHCVFLISWCNPDQRLAAAKWDDYVRAVLFALDAAAAIADTPDVDAMGFCIGGALLGCAAALDAGRTDDAEREALRWSLPADHPLAQRLRPVRADARRPVAAKIASLSLLTTLLDYTDTGVLRLFIDDKQVRERESTIGDPAAPGLMTANEFGNTFSLLRPKELHWHYVQHNYMLGATPAAFDMLFWNGDGTHLPGPMFCWYLRQLYLDNRLREPGGLQVCGAPVDLRAITVPAFVYGSRDDHIVPWKSAYASLPLLGGPVSFVLGASGHIAGIVNPPAANKRGFWHLPGDSRTTGTDAANDNGPPDAAARGNGAGTQHAVLDADGWFAQSQYEAGSWWPTWCAWLAARQSTKGSVSADGTARAGQRRSRAERVGNADAAARGAERIADVAHATAASQAPVREDTDPDWRYGSAAYPVIEAAPGRYVGTPSARNA